MPPPVERTLAAWLAAGARGIGQILITSRDGAFSLRHREDEGKQNLEVYRSPNDALELAKFSDDGKYRPLKTAPNLRHGWLLEVADLTALRQALDFFYPGRLAALAAWETKRLPHTSLRATLRRQTGMYRVTAKISDEQVDELVDRVCRSQGGAPGCLRTILWPRDEALARPSLRLPLEKFIVPGDQTGGGENVIPLICQEACNILVAEARKVVKGE